MDSVGPQKEDIDYTAMDGGALLEALGDDAYLWSEAYCQHACKFGFNRDDRGIMITWFANAIEHSHDVRRWRAERAAKGSAPIVVPPLKID